MWPKDILVKTFIPVYKKNKHVLMLFSFSTGQKCTTKEDKGCIGNILSGMEARQGGMWYVI